MMKIGPIMEIIVYAEDMDSLVKFYRDTMGLPLSYPLDLDEFHDQMWVTFETGECTLALHGGGKRRLGLDAPKFVFEVADVEETRKALIEHGVPLGAIRSAAPGVYVCDGADPEGNRFSIESHT